MRCIVVESMVTQDIPVDEASEMVEWGKYRLSGSKAQKKKDLAACTSIVGGLLFEGGI